MQIHSCLATCRFAATKVREFGCLNITCLLKIRQGRVNLNKIYFGGCFSFSAAPDVCTHGPTVISRYPQAWKCCWANVGFGFITVRKSSLRPTGKFSSRSTTGSGWRVDDAAAELAAVHGSTCSSSRTAPSKLMAPCRQHG